MSDPIDSAEEKKKAHIGLALFILILLAILITVMFSQRNKDSKYDEFNLAEEIGSSEQGAPLLDLEKLIAPRILGNANASVKISEHSSFTCGGCGLFHQTTFKKIKDEYIDTGKAYLVFDDLPRNVEDVSISAIARCVPEDKYFKFIEFLYFTQKDWIRSPDYLEKIKSDAIIAGVSEAKLAECFNSKELREALAGSAERAYKENGIDRTPTLVINDVHKITGLDPYVQIKALIEEELAKVKIETAIEAPTAAEEETEAEAVTPEAPVIEEIEVIAPVQIPPAIEKPVVEEVLEEEAVTPPAFETLEPEAGEETEAEVPSDAKEEVKDAVKEDEHAVLDIDAAIAPRSIGDENAPLKIREYSSFTCGACKAFHEANFAKVKAEYVDTGKAQLIFDDFPRNGSDITVGAIAKCVPEKAYFKFISLIFNTQSTWMKKSDYADFIKQNAKLTGVNSEFLEECSSNKKIQEGIAVRGQAAYEGLGIDSTPTVIINDERRVIGAVSYEEFKKVLDEELAKVETTEQ